MARRKIKIAKVAHLTGHKDAVYDFSIDKENMIIYSVAADGYVVKWEPLKSTEGTLVLQSDQTFYASYLDQRNQIFYVGTRNGELFIIDLKASKLVDQVQLSNSPIYSLSQWQDFLCIGTGEGDLILKKDNSVQKLSISSEPLRVMAHSRSNLAIGSSDHKVHLLNQDFEVIQRLEGHSNSVFALDFLDERNLISSGRDAIIKLWDLDIYQVIKSIPAHMYQVKSLDVGDQYILSCSMDKTLKLWDAKLNLLKVIDQPRDQGHSNCVNRAMWLNERMFVSSSDDRSLMVWQIENNH